MVFLKALGGVSPYSEALDCLKEICNRIASTTEILREYKCKVTAEGMTSVILMRKMKELERIGKTKDVYQTQLNHARTLIQRANLPLPTDSFDHKFFVAAIACKARYIITTDPGSLALSPYNHPPINMKIVKPTEYVTENC
jgi:predicted nucleic acid-binding protein